MTVATLTTMAAIAVATPFAGIIQDTSADQSQDLQQSTVLQDASAYSPKLNEESLRPGWPELVTTPLSSMKPTTEGGGIIIKNYPRVTAGQGCWQARLGNLIWSIGYIHPVQ